MKTAMIIGSTGLIGSYLLEKLVQSPEYSQIIAIIRGQSSVQDPAYSHPKVRRITFDFQNWSNLSMQIASFSGNSSTHFFCCLGTTIKKVKTEEAFRKVDYDYIIEFAKMAQKCKAERLLVVSAIGADRNSTVFYNRIKGETENDVQNNFAGKLYFLRPSLLLGDRKEFRFGERIAILLAPAYSLLLVGPLSRYKPIKASDVAQAMVNISTNKTNASTVITNDEILNLAMTE
jgi:uncharacterized protein YbjT (DUF2867 family)